MLRDKVPWSYLESARIFEMEWTGLIYTRRGWGVQIRDK